MKESANEYLGNFIRKFVKKGYRIEITYSASGTKILFRKGEWCKGVLVTDEEWEETIDITFPRAIRMIEDKLLTEVTDVLV